MANIVIIKTANSIVVTFNDYSSIVESLKTSFDIKHIIEVRLKSDRVEVYI